MTTAGATTATPTAATATVAVATVAVATVAVTTTATATATATATDTGAATTRGRDRAVRAARAPLLTRQAAAPAAAGGERPLFPCEPTKAVTTLRGDTDAF